MLNLLIGVWRATQHLIERLDFMKTHEEQLEEKIKVLEMNLAFLRWKIWYYQTAAEAGTESIHLFQEQHKLNQR